MTAVAGAALLVHSGSVAIADLTLDARIAHMVGAAMVVAVALLVAACGIRRTPVKVGAFRLPLPTVPLALVQIGAAVADIGFASLALFVLIPGSTPDLLPAFVLAYAMGIIAAVVTHVPGSIGVFEAVVLAIVPGDRAALLAALIAYRVVYYLLPLGIAFALLMFTEGMRLRTGIRPGRILGGAREVAGTLTPLIASGATFAGGAMLLLSGSLPALRDRMGVLAGVLPLPFIEASHVAASLVGTGLLLLAPGLYRRLDGAFIVTRALLVAGALFSLAKGVDYEEAVVCLTLAGLLQWSRGAFFRRTALTSALPGPAWLMATVAVMVLVTWTGLFAYRHVPYDDALWWRFAVDADAPRFLRALLGVGVLLTVAAIWRLMAPTRPAGESPAGEIETIRSILPAADRTEAMLALTGDKRFMVSEGNAAFVMYQVSGSTWVVMGDPVGPVEAWADVMWRLRDHVDREQGRLLLYEISPQMLELAIGMGLQIIKYGEEAIVPLADFTVDTPRLRSPRRAERAVEKKGATFRVVPAERLSIVIDELAQVSDEWLRIKGQREKAFSLGRFDRAYLAAFDIALVELDGRIVAFANLWLTPNRREASIDLMRHRETAPSGTMDFLFVRLFEWAKTQGYQRFSLGMAPLSGIDRHRLAPVWAKVATFVYRHGERLYGFKGLRSYKDKFAPLWEPRFVAATGAVGMIRGLRDLSVLVNAGSGAMPSVMSRGSLREGMARLDSRPGTEPDRKRPIAIESRRSRGTVAPAGVDRILDRPEYICRMRPAEGVVWFGSGDDGNAGDDRLDAGGHILGRIDRFRPKHIADIDARRDVGPYRANLLINHRWPARRPRPSVPSGARERIGERLAGSIHAAITPRGGFWSGSQFSVTFPTVDAGENIADAETSATVAWQQRWSGAGDARTTFSTSLAVQFPVAESDQQTDVIALVAATRLIGDGVGYANAYVETQRGRGNPRATEWGVLGGYKCRVARRLAVIGDILYSRGGDTPPGGAVQLELSALIAVSRTWSLGPGAFVSQDVRTPTRRAGAGIVAAVGF